MPHLTFANLFLILLMVIIINNLLQINIIITDHEELYIVS